MFNAKSTFNRSDVKLRPCAFVLDDAHAGIEEIRDSFTLMVRDETHKELVKLLATSCENYKPGLWNDLENNRPSTYLEIPYWIWKANLTKIQPMLAEHSLEDDFIFVWPFLRDILRWCRCVVSGRGAEIIPEVLPVEEVQAFFDAKHRLFMSATIADDSVLVCEIGCDLTSALKPIVPEEKSGIGERMVLSPTLVDKKYDRSWVMELCKKLSKKVKVVVLAPSKESAKEWEPFGAKVIMTGDILSALEELKDKSKALGFMVFSQRYDGIDLPDDSCRILIMDGMPYGEGIIDKYDGGVLNVSGGVRNRLIYRIEQGMGRAVRSNADYAVIILAGPEIASFVTKKDIKDTMNPETKLQLNLAHELARLSREEATLGSDHSIRDMVDQCLNRDDGWKDFYNEKIRNADFLNDSEEKGFSAIHLADAERKAFQLVISNDSNQGAKVIDEAINKHIKDESSKGWYLQKLANYTHEINQGEAIKIQAKAHQINSQAFTPPGQIKVLKPGKLDVQRKIIEWFLGFDDPNGIIAELEILRAQLSYDVKPKVMERAICKLAQLLGAEGSRPEEEFNKGPDGLWIWPSLPMVIEVKNENKKFLHKKDAGQLHQSLEWFKSNYLELGAPRPIVVAKVFISDNNAIFPDKTRVLTPENMKSLLDNLETFYRAIAKLDPIFKAELKIHELQDQHKLSPGQFIGQYTVPIKQSKK